MVFKMFRKKRNAIRYARKHKGGSIVQYNKSVRTKKGYRKGKITGYGYIR